MLTDHLKYSKEISAVLIQWTLSIFTTVDTLLRLLLLPHSGSCAAQRYFRILRGRKTWLRLAMTQNRLHFCRVAHIHKDMLREILWQKGRGVYTTKGSKPTLITTLISETHSLLFYT